MNSDNTPLAANVNPRSTGTGSFPGASALFALGLLAAFFVGLFYVFRLRFSSGEAYPAGSSLRADPRGTLALHDSLAVVRGIRVERNLDQLSRLRVQPDGSALFLLGYDSEMLEGPIPKSIVNELDDFAQRGGRVVIAVAYARQLDVTNGWVAALRQNRRTAAVGDQSQQILADRWGIKMDTSTSATLDAQHDQTIPGLSDQIPWAGVRQFKGVQAPWKVIYERDGEAVVVERPLGKGSVVLLADDALLSNQALRHRRETGLLTWLVGPCHRIIFEETHLGLRQTPGLASLVGRYRLGGAVIGLLLLVGLYLWQQSLPFVPRRTHSNNGGPRETAWLSGRDASTGFRNLLRQAVPAHDLPIVLFERWKNTLGRRLPAERLRDAQDIVNLEKARPLKEHSPLRTYREVFAKLHSRSTH